MRKKKIKLGEREKVIICTIWDNFHLAFERMKESKLHTEEGEAILKEKSKHTNCIFDMSDEEILDELTYMSFAFGDIAWHYFNKEVLIPDMQSLNNKEIKAQTQNTP